MQHTRTHVGSAMLAANAYMSKRTYTRTHMVHDHHAQFGVPEPTAPPPKITIEITTAHCPVPTLTRQSDEAVPSP